MTSTQPKLTPRFVARNDLWSERAEDWAATMEPLNLPLYLAVLERARLTPESALLDAGCGAGGFLRLAAATGLGADLTGVDASIGLTEIARERIPEAEIELGDIEHLPYADHSFDIVTALNTVQFSNDARAALKDIVRVTKVGGRVILATWASPEHCEASFYLRALGGFLPADAGGLSPFVYSAPRALENLALDAGLTPVQVAEVDSPWHFRNLDMALRALLSPGYAVRAIRLSSEALVRAAVAEAIAPFRTSRGEYRLENRVRFIVARRVVALYTTYLRRV